MRSVDSLKKISAWEAFWDELSKEGNAGSNFDYWSKRIGALLDEKYFFSRIVSFEKERIEVEFEAEERMLVDPFLFPNSFHDYRFPDGIRPEKIELRDGRPEGAILSQLKDHFLHIKTSFIYSLAPARLQKERSTSLESHGTKGNGRVGYDHSTLRTLLELAYDSLSMDKEVKVEVRNPNHFLPCLLTSPADRDVRETVLGIYQTLGTVNLCELSKARKKIITSLEGEVYEGVRSDLGAAWDKMRKQAYATALSNKDPKFASARELTNYLQ